MGAAAAIRFSAAAAVASSATNRAGQSHAKFKVDVLCTHLGSELCRLLELRHLTARRVRYERRRALHERDAWRDWAQAMRAASLTLPSFARSSPRGGGGKRARAAALRRHRVYARRRASSPSSSPALELLVSSRATASPRHRDDPRLPFHEQFASPEWLAADQPSFSWRARGGGEQRRRVPQFNVTAHLLEYTPAASLRADIRHHSSHRRHRHRGDSTIRDSRYLQNTRAAYADLALAAG